jgi:hypothetical protein
MGFPFCESFFPWLDERSALHRRNHRRPCLNFRAMMRSQHPYVSILCLMVSRGQSPPCDQCDESRLSLRFRARGIAWRGFLSCDPRASDRLLGSLPPFSACCRAMRLGRGAIDDGNVVRGQFHQGAEQALPPSAHRPAMEPIVNRGRRPLDCRTILPATPRPQHMNDAANDAPVIHSRRARSILWQQRLNRRPLPLVQPNFPAMIQAPQFELES